MRFAASDTLRALLAPARFRAEAGLRPEGVLWKALRAASSRRGVAAAEYAIIAVAVIVVVGVGIAAFAQELNLLIAVRMFEDIRAAVGAR
ncbi:hypothetical protein [Roseomonas sp. HF4]|uniref:hypothetical protein n=1 Tax=Roseomonas sp. HF4 TaxID=2562313 RepID=UPI0010BF8155|nr:hypothetical protein [Roseomonas sp. HF4]